MALESGSGIWSLVVTNPATSDDVSQGDDHIRLIKSSLKQTFPLLSATVNVSHSDLNALGGISSNVQAQFDAASSNLINTIAYGSMYLSGSSTEFSASTSADLYVGFITPGDVSYGVTPRTASGALIVTRAGHYKGQATLSISASTAANITISLYVDNVDTGLHASTLVPAQGRSCLTVSGDVSMGASQELRMRILATTAKLITVKDAQLSVRRIN